MLLLLKALSAIYSRPDLCASEPFPTCAGREWLLGRHLTVRLAGLAVASGFSAAYHWSLSQAPGVHVESQVSLTCLPHTLQHDLPVPVLTANPLFFCQIRHTFQNCLSQQLCLTSSHCHETEENCLPQRGWKQGPGIRQIQEVIHGVRMGWQAGVG